MKTKLFIFVLGLIGIIPCSWATEAVTVEVLLRIKEAQTETPILVAGKIALVYTCPECPKDAQCKPCARDHLVLADSTKSNLQIVVWLEQPLERFKKLKVGENLALWVVYVKENNVGIENEHGLFAHRITKITK